MVIPWFGLGGDIQKDTRRGSVRFVGIDVRAVSLYLTFIILFPFVNA